MTHPFAAPPPEPDDGESGLVSLIQYPVEVLGPGTRVGIWLQGCCRRCPDCISPHTWPFDEATRQPLSAILKRLKGHALFTDQLTISGGEPFAQPRFLERLLRAARAPDLGYTDILVYTGHVLEDLRASVPSLLGLIDALIDGPYLVDRPTDLAWCGSDNQRLHVLTDDPDRRAFYEAFRAEHAPRSRVQIVRAPTGLFMVGIPKDTRWKEIIHPADAPTPPETANPSASPEKKDV